MCGAAVEVCKYVYEQCVTSVEKVKDLGMLNNSEL